MRLLRFYDPRFARDPRFFYYLFSQKMRHAAVREMSKLRGGEHLAKIRELIEDPGFDEELKWACRSVENMNSERGKKLRNQLSQVMTKTGNNMAWSPGERTKSQGHMYAMGQTYGMGGFFVTYSPSMKDQRFAIRMMKREQKKGKVWEELPGVAERSELVAKNPAECARVFDMMTRSFLTKIVGVALTNGVGRYRATSTKNAALAPGAFGEIPYRAR